MKIDLTILVPVAAVVSSVLLLMAGRKRVLEVIALISSGVWLVVQLGLLKWPLHHRYLTLGMVIGAILLVTGVAVYLKTQNKREVTASTVLAILGGTLLVGALARLG
jgi:hypothetical protein